MSQIGLNVVINGPFQREKVPKWPRPSHRAHLCRCPLYLRRLRRQPRCLRLLHQVLLHSDWLHQVCARCHAICYLLCSCLFFDPLMLCLLDTCRVGTAAKISAQPWRASSTLGSNRARRCTQTQLKPQSLSSATALACWSEMRRANGDGWSDATVMRRARSLILFCYA